VKLLALLGVASSLAGCAHIGHAHGTTFCGTHVETGAVVVGFQPLDPAVPAPPGPIPTASVLPAAATGDLSPARAHFVSTSPNCHIGAVVTVTPPDGARLAAQISSSSGDVAGIVLDDITRPVQVSAWVGGQYAGGLKLTAPAG
jgi:hypothetical protein